MKPLLVIATFASCLFVGSTAFAAVEETQETSVAKRYGPYEALNLNRKVLHDVKFESDGNVYLQLLPEHRDKEIVVKISNDYFGGYRQWWHGGYELSSPANQGKPPYAWTDYVNTSARFIEYWMDGEVILHLKRVE